MNNSNNFDDLISFIRVAIGEFKLPITRETLIEDDLGVSGDDAIDLVNSFSKKYRVDISNFNFKKYFFDEPGIFNFQDRSISPFTVGDLEKAIIAGKLDETVIGYSK